MGLESGGGDRESMHASMVNLKGIASVTTRPNAQVGNFPPLPCSAGGGIFRFDASHCSTQLSVATPNCLRCLNNATRASQGVCFLEPVVQRGQHASLRIR